MIVNKGMTQRECGGMERLSSLKFEIPLLQFAQEVHFPANIMKQT
jgi:hypothetical protein